jgi:cysteine desulfurase
MLQLPVYMDYHATTPCDSRVLEAMIPYFSRNYGNASSKSHAFGWQAEEAVQIAREQLAELINASPSEIIFTSGATESVNLAIKGVYEMFAGKGKHIITVSTEHKAVLDTCHHLETQGADISRIRVQADGLLDLDHLKSSLRKDTILIALMWANNETGVLQPVKLISELARERSVYFFTDATQALGKVPVDVEKDGIDLLACSAHKLYGPKGVGALYIRRKNPRVRLSPQLDGGGQERGFRSGTLNVPGIVGFGKAAYLATSEMNDYIPMVSGLRDRLEKSLLTIQGARLNGHAFLRLPTVTNISFAGESGPGLADALGKDLAVSTGSACHSANPEPSHVLKAMGLSDELSYRALRFSLGKYNTSEEVNFVIEKVKQTLKKLGSEMEKLKFQK